MSRYLGRDQVAVCQRSGKKVRRADLVEDDQVKGLLVDKKWYEIYHPQLLPPPMRADGIPHFRPAPDDNLAPPAPVLTLNPTQITVGGQVSVWEGYAAVSGFATGPTFNFGAITNAATATPAGTIVQFAFQEGSDAFQIAIQGATAAPAQTSWTSLTVKCLNNVGVPITLTINEASVSTFSQVGKVSIWNFAGIGQEPRAVLGDTWTINFAGITPLKWTQTSNNIGFTDYYIVSSVTPVTGVLVPIVTVPTPDTYTIDKAGSFTLVPFPFPVNVSVAAGTKLVVQAHVMASQLGSGGGGLSLPSNQVTA